jgi:hypothetical protein
VLPPGALRFQRLRLVVATKEKAPRRQEEQREVEEPAGKQPGLSRGNDRVRLRWSGPWIR